MLGQYLPILALLILAILFAALSFVASGLLAPRRKTAAKTAPYECGIVPLQEPVERFPVKFYIVAMLFVIFDVEIIFLYPWATTFPHVDPAAAGEWLGRILFFLFTTVVAYLYGFRKGVFKFD